jgi:hypothetical protein
MSGNSIYTEAALNNRKFRLLSIQPALNEHDRLECTCITFDLDNAPAYEALSYVWGTPEEHHEILCNGLSIAIQPNLSAALRRLRFQRSARMIWADAICINQNDNVEKSHQVPLMGSIYSSAERVVVWLGHGDPQKTRIAFESLRYIAKACYLYNQENGIDDENFLKAGEAVRLPEEAFSSSVCSSLHDLFDKPWFSRIWCVQEIQLAEDAIVLWGQDKISWADMGTAASWIFDQTTGTVDENDSVAQLLLDVYVARADMMRMKKMDTLLVSLQNFREFEASDPRDKVYGLLNLVSPRSEVEALEVDYNKSVGQVYADTVLLMTQVYSLLSTLAYVTHPEDYADDEYGHDNEECNDGDDECRSWAPLWNNLTTARVLGQPDIDCPWRPCGQEVVLVANKSDSEPYQLWLRGILYETVQEVEDVMDFYLEKKDLTPNNGAFGISRSTPVKLQPFLKVFKRLHTDSISGDIQESVLSLAYTMTAGIWHDEYIQHHDTELQEKYLIACMQFILRVHELQETGDDRESRNGTHSKEFEDEAFDTCSLRRMFWTENASLGLGPQCMEVGDIVVVLHGGNTPYVLRPKGDNYLFMGQAYVHDIMYGQLMEKLRLGEVKEQDFCLV